MIRSCCLLSVLSVCLNTPQTFELHPELKFVTLAIDCVTGFVLVCEVILKMASKGIIKGTRPYFATPGRIFEFFMVFCILVSIILQVLEIAIALDKKVKHYVLISLIRTFRPLLLFRIVKSVLKLSLPKNVSLRSLKQIWGVILFYAYFITFAAFIGVQIFGSLKYYCIRQNATTSNVSYSDLLIPIQRCSPPEFNHQTVKCPGNFVCKELFFTNFRQDKTLFDYVLPGFLTVYETASLEGWTEFLYDTMDSRHYLFGVVYFISVVFFIAWMVRNVFIAIITEAFADLRLQVNKLSKPQVTKDNDDYIVLRKQESKMMLVQERQVIPKNYFTKAVFDLCHSKVFTYFILLCVLVDALVQAFYLNVDNKLKIQCVFTVLFDLEVIVKLIGYGWRQFFHSRTCRFELILAILSTLSLPLIFRGYTAFVIFQVIRFFRVVLIWNSLTFFMIRILGSGKMISSLVFFTILTLIITSGFTLQLFCGICIKDSCETEQYKNFQFGEFPKAFKAIFQVFMAEAWNQVMNDVVYVGQQPYSFFIFIVFILIHLLASTILISVFVALILDNLEFSEQLKLLKQKRQGEEVADTHKHIPARIRVFKRLDPHPNIVKVPCLDANVLPKVRQSFLTKYVNSGEEIGFEMPLISMQEKERARNSSNINIDNTNSKLKYIENQPLDKSFQKSFRKQSSVTAFMQEAYMKRASIHSGSINAPVRSMSILRSSRHRTLSTGRTATATPGPVPGNRVNKNRTAVSSIISQNTNLHSLLMKETSASKNKMKDLDLGLDRQKIIEARRKKEEQIEDLRENQPVFDKSLFLFSTDNKFRQIMQKIVKARFTSDRTIKVGAFSFGRIKQYFGTQTYLDWLMLFLTQLSCVAMYFETPSKRTFDSTWTTVVEYIFVTSTSIEIFLKVIANGLFLAPNAFIQDVGGVLHVMIYIVSLTYVIWKPTLLPPGSAAQVLLVLRALRPIRIITLAPPLRKVVWVLVRGYRDIIKVALLLFALMFIFASYGVQIFSGKLKRCNDNTIKTEVNCTGVFQRAVATPDKLVGLRGSNPCILVPRVWRNPRNFNFDNMGSAFLALLEVLSLEGWTDVRDILEEQIGWMASLYPHIYVFFACLIGLTLFIGVIVNNFNENKGTALLTVEQKRWKDLKKKLELAQPLHLPPKPEKLKRARLYQIFISKHYNRVYSVIVLLSCATLFAGQWEPLNEREDAIKGLVIVAALSCIVFVIDTSLKIFAFSFKGYMLSWRYRFDFLLTLLGIAFCIWTTVSCSGDFKNEQCKNCRLFGVAMLSLRFISLSGKHNKLTMLMLTVLMSLTKSFYTIAVLFMIMLCYVFVGVILFGSVKTGIALNGHANFKTSFNALLLTFRISTGEDWNKLMRDAMISEPYCRLNLTQNYWESNCGNPVAAQIFFHSYFIIITYILLNLFIAVVIENFSIFYSTDDYPIMSQQDIAQFQDKWNMVDTNKSGAITLDEAREVLEKLTGEISINYLKRKQRLYFKRVMAELERIDAAGNDITFHSLLFAIAYKKIDIETNLQLEERLERTELEYAILEEVATQTVRDWIAKIWKRRKEMKKKKKYERRDSGMYDQ